MRITFILPHYNDYAIGGYKIVYEHANRLAERGFRVSLVLPRQESPRTGLFASALDAVWGARTLRRTLGMPITWFPISRQVQLCLVPDLLEKWIPESEAIIATLWSTAPLVLQYSSTKGKKFHLVQHYEIFGGPQEKVDAALQLPIDKIVVAQWLIDKIKTLDPNAKCHYLPNAVNFDEFSVTQRPETRKPHVLTMGHTDIIKGFTDGIDALDMIHEEMPEVRLTAFGVAGRPYYLPPYVDYVCRPNSVQLRELYNSASVFMYPSWSEGWGLAPAEAMACGCAVVCAQNDGVLEYAEPNRNILLVPIRRPHIIAKKCVELLKDDQYRIEISRQGTESIRKFTWERASSGLESILTSTPV